MSRPDEKFIFHAKTIFMTKDSRQIEVQALKIFEPDCTILQETYEGLREGRHFVRTLLLTPDHPPFLVFYISSYCICVLSVFMCSMCFIRPSKAQFFR